MFNPKYDQCAEFIKYHFQNNVINPMNPEEQEKFNKFAYELAYFYLVEKHKANGGN